MRECPKGEVTPNMTLSPRQRPDPLPQPLDTDPQEALLQDPRRSPCKEGVSQWTQTEAEKVPEVDGQERALIRIPSWGGASSPGPLAQQTVPNPKGKGKEQLLEA